MTDHEYLRKLVAELDAKLGDVLSVLEGVGDDDDDADGCLQVRLEELQAEISDWQEAKGYI